MLKAREVGFKSPLLDSILETLPADGGEEQRFILENDVSESEVFAHDRLFLQVLRTESNERTADCKYINHSLILTVCSPLIF